MLSRLGDKWSMLVLIALHANGVMRFSEIHRSLGDISHRMLTVTLRTLEADGMVARTVYAEVPPRVEYRLTARGESLLPHVFGLVEWARANMEGFLRIGGKIDYLLCRPDAGHPFRKGVMCGPAWKTVRGSPPDAG